jgi:hypothetical protein
MNFLFFLIILFGLAIFFYIFGNYFKSLNSLYPPIRIISLDNNNEYISLVYPNDFLRFKDLLETFYNEISDTNIDVNKYSDYINIKISDKENEIYENVRNTLVNQGVVFFGGYAISLYSQYMPKHFRKKIEKFADFDVLSNNPETTAEIVKERLKDIDVKNVKIIKRLPVGEIVPIHYEIKVGNDTIAFIYQPIGCHSYNIININNQKVKIATIDTMLSFYLAFLYTDRPYYNEFSDRILCMSKFLFDVQQKNRLQQKGLLKRFSITCYGHQESVEEIRAHKSNKFKELKNKRGTKEYEEWFLNYKPEDIRLKKEEQQKFKLSKKIKKTKKSNKKSKKRNNFLNLFTKKTRKNKIY